MFINKKLFRICWAVLFSFLFIACNNDEPTNDQLLSRLFRPGSFARSIEGTNVMLSWLPIKNATYYIEYGRALPGVPFEEVEDLQILSLGRVSSHQLTDLWGSTRYAIRIKAVSTIPEVNDSEYVYSNFTTGAENIFYPLTFGLDNTDFYIMVKWDVDKEVSHIMIDNLQLGSKEFLLTAEEIAIGEKKIENSPDYRLRAGQQYTISIYLDERKRGENSITLQRPE